MTRIHGVDRTTAKAISGHLSDAMFTRCDIVDEADIRAAKRMIDQRRRKSQPIEDAAQQTATVDIETLLSGVPREKLEAIIALLK